jgi:hypothetical protein
MAVTNLSPEVRKARELLRNLSALPEAEARVYWNIMAASKQRKLFGLRFSAVTAGMMLSASAALGFGLASSFERPFRAVAPMAPVVAATTAPKPHPPRQSSRGVEVPSTGGLSEGAQALDVGTTQSRPLGEAVSGSTTRTNPSPGAASAAATKPLTQPSELSQEVADYRGAVAHLPADPSGALVQLEAYRKRWPAGALLHEVDLRIIQVLVALGRHAEAQKAAAQFLGHYPESARAEEVRRIAEPAPSDADNED